MDGTILCGPRFKMVTAQAQAATQEHSCKARV